MWAEAPRTEGHQTSPEQRGPGEFTWENSTTPLSCPLQDSLFLGSPTSLRIFPPLCPCPLHISAHRVSGSESARSWFPPFQPLRLRVKLMSSQARHMCVYSTSNPINFCGSCKIRCQKKGCHFGIPVNLFSVWLIETKSYRTAFWLRQKNQLLVHNSFLVTSRNLSFVLMNLLTIQSMVSYLKIRHAGNGLFSYLSTFFQTLTIWSSTCLLCSSSPLACKLREGRSCFILLPVSSGFTPVSGVMVWQELVGRDGCVT